MMTDATTAAVDKDEGDIWSFIEQQQQDTTQQKERKKKKKRKKRSSSNNKKKKKNTLSSCFSSTRMMIVLVILFLVYYTIVVIFREETVVENDSDSAATISNSSSIITTTTNNNITTTVAITKQEQENQSEKNDNTEEQQQQQELLPMANNNNVNEQQSDLDDDNNDNTIKEENNNSCLEYCQKEKEEKNDSTNNMSTNTNTTTTTNMTTTTILQSMLNSFEIEIDKFHDMLQTDYGSIGYQSMWINPKTKQRWDYKDILRSTSPAKSSSSSDSYYKFQRKLQLKILKVVLLLQQKDQGEEYNNINDNSINKQCDCSLNTTTYYENFVWSTGGHSAAAGHGNLYNESYTSYLVRGVENAFANALRIKFAGRNYGYGGGVDSGPLLSLCNEAIYGIDADVLSWDFGMTDGPKGHYKSTLWASRNSVHRNRPAHVSINLSGKHYKPRLDAVARVEESAGSTSTLHLQPHIQDKIIANAPDYDDEESTTNTSDLLNLTNYGLYAQYIRCKGMTESKGLCAKKKFNHNVCPNRKLQVSWHPGWKVQAITGNMLASSVLDYMKEALNDIIMQRQQSTTTSSIQDMYDKLRKEENDDHTTFISSSEKEFLSNDYYPDILSELNNITNNFTSNILYRNLAYCKISLLPSQTRYLNLAISDEENTTTTIRNGYEYNMGIESSVAFNTTTTPKNNKIELVYNEEEFNEGKCIVKENIAPNEGIVEEVIDLTVDSKNYFFASSTSSSNNNNSNTTWSSIVFPNIAEQNHYTTTTFISDKKKNNIIVCAYAWCGKTCTAPGAIQLNNEYGIQWGMDLNSIPIIELVSLKLDNCFILKQQQKEEDGTVFVSSNENGQYKLDVWIKNPTNETETKINFLRFVSIIVL